MRHTQQLRSAVWASLFELWFKLSNSQTPKLPLGFATLRCLGCAVWNLVQTPKLPNSQTPYGLRCLKASPFGSLGFATLRCLGFAV
jgi:hypothetical protein